MTTQGDEILRDELETAIDATARPVSDGVCGSHDGIRQGVNVLLRCKKAEMGGAEPMGKATVTVIASGVAAALLGILEAIKALTTK